MMTHERETEEERLAMVEKAERYIKSRVTVDPDSGCWMWDLATNEGGYGRGTFNYSSWLTHRLSYHYLVKYLHRKVAVHHMCGVSGCCNPDHLQQVTWQDNTAEMLARTNLLEEIQALRDEIERLNGLLDTQHTEGCGIYE